MPSEQSRLRVSQTNGVTTVEFLDRNIIDEARIQAIGDELAALIDAQPKPKLLINFASVDHLTSAALGTLILISNKVRDRGGKLRLANIDPQIKEVFHITRLDQLFSIHPTTADALGTFD